MNKSLEYIFEALQEGKRFGYYYALRFPVFHTVLCKSDSGSIYVSSAGSFHIENSIEKLQWLFEVLFEVTPEKFLEENTIYDECYMRAWEQIADAQNTTDYRRWNRDSRI